MQCDSEAFDIYNRKFHELHPEEDVEDHTEVLIIRCNEITNFIVSFTLEAGVKEKCYDKYLYFIKNECIGGILGSSIEEKITNTPTGGSIKLPRNKLRCDMFDKDLYAKTRCIKRIETEPPKAEELYTKLIDVKEIELELLFKIVFNRFQLIRNINEIRVTKNVTAEQVIEEKTKLINLFPLSPQEDNISHFFIIQSVAPFINEEGKKYLLEAEKAITYHRLSQNIRYEEDLKATLKRNKINDVIFLNGCEKENIRNNSKAIMEDLVEYYRMLNLRPSIEKICGIPFEHALSYIRTRRTVMYAGYCFFDCTIEKDILLDYITVNINKSIAAVKLYKNEFGGIEDICIDYFGKESYEAKFIHHMRLYLNNITIIREEKYPQLKVFKRKAQEKIKDMKINHYPPCMSHYLLKLQREGHLPHYQRLDLSSFFINLGFHSNDIEDFFSICVNTDKLKIYKTIHARTHQKDERPDWGVGCQWSIESDRGHGENFHGCIFRKDFRNSSATVGLYNDILELYNLPESTIVAVKKLASGNSTDSCMNACSMLCSSVAGSHLAAVIKRPPHFYFEVQDLTKQTLDQAAMDLGDKFDLSPPPKNNSHDNQRGIKRYYDEIDTKQ